MQVSKTTDEPMSIGDVVIERDAQGNAIAYSILISVEAQLTSLKSRAAQGLPPTVRVFMAEALEKSEEPAAARTSKDSRLSFDTNQVFH